MNHLINLVLEVTDLPHWKTNKFEAHLILYQNKLQRNQRNLNIKNKSIKKYKKKVYRKYF